MRQELPVKNIGPYMIGAKTQPGFVRGVDIRKIEVVKFRANGKRNIEANNFSNLKTMSRLKLSLRTADVLPVVASLPPKKSRERGDDPDDRKYVCCSQAN